MAPATSDVRLGQRRVRGDQTLNEGRTFAEPDERAAVVVTGDRDLAPRPGAEFLGPVSRFWRCSFGEVPRISTRLPSARLPLA
jgi:hypothetical protein